MKVGFGETTLQKGIKAGHIDGIGTYCLNMKQYLGVQCSLVSCAYGRDLPEQVFSLGKSYALPTFKYLGVNARFDESELKDKIDFFHATDHIIPKFKTIPVLANLMDPIPLVNPEWAWGKSKIGHLKNYVFKRMAQSADHYITISEFVVDDLVKHFGINRDRISVTPLGVDENYFVPPSIESVSGVSKKFKIKNKYFLFLGTLQPRKNIERIIHAYIALPKKIREEYKLVIAGRLGWGVEHVPSLIQSLESAGQGMWLNYVTEEEKKVLLSQATALVFPSLYEGFGLPVLEAFASGTTVLTSNTTSLPEVSAGGAVLVDPYSVKDITTGLLDIIHDQAMVEEKCRLGLKRAKELSWRATADRTFKVYQKLV